MTSIWFSAQTLCGSTYEMDPQPPPAKTTKVSTSNHIIPQCPKKCIRRDQTGIAPMTTPHYPYKLTTTPATPKASNQKTIQLPSRKHRERYNMKIFVDPTKPNLITGFTTRIKEWFSARPSNQWSHPTMVQIIQIAPYPLPIQHPNRNESPQELLPC